MCTLYLQNTVQVSGLLQVCVFLQVLWYIMLLLPCCDVRYDFRLKMMFSLSVSLVDCRRVHVLFTLFGFVCTQSYPMHIVMYFCFVCLRLVYPMLPVSLDCPAYISYKNVYFKKIKWLTLLILLKVVSLRKGYNANLAMI